VVVFASHEILGHKLLAQKYGASAEYRIWYFGLLLGIVTAIIPGGFVFAAPGAVMISPIVKKKFAFTIARLTKKQMGVIALGGPLVNIILGIGLLIVNYFYPVTLMDVQLFELTARISFFLAFFNLIPFPPMDGQKIIRWNLYIWLILIATSVVGFLFI